MSELYMREIGAGTAVVALHGFGADHRLMTGLLEPVFVDRRGYRRLYVDLPASGQSPAEGVRSTQDVADAVEAAIEQRVGDEPFLIVGESYGGYVSREIVRRRPAQVRGLALICPVAQPVHALRQVPPHEVRVANPELLGRLSAAEREEFEPMAVVQTEQAYDRFKAEIAPGLAVGNTAGLGRISVGGYALPEPPDRGEPFAGPTVIIAGKQDSVVGYLDQWDLMSHYPRATYAVLDSAGHNAHLERPQVTTALLHDWLERVPT